MMEREPFDLRDYRQRLRDRTDDHELLLDGARVEAEVERLREAGQAKGATIRELRRTNSRLRKAVTWLMGTVHNLHEGDMVDSSVAVGDCTFWECQRARVVLDETASEDKAVYTEEVGASG
jgi:hypothetical protein